MIFTSYLNKLTKNNYGLSGKNFSLTTRRKRVVCTHYSVHPIQKFINNPLIYIIEWRLIQYHRSCGAVEALLLGIHYQVLMSIRHMKNGLSLTKPHYHITHNYKSITQFTCFLISIYPYTYQLGPWNYPIMEATIQFPSKS